MVLAVFAGLPGVGKTTLAQQVGAALPAVVLAVDTVDSALRTYDVRDPGLAAYGVVAALAETQLTLGHSVIIDAVNPVRAVRQLWTDLAERLDVPLRVVEVVCGDDEELRRRLEAGGAGAAGQPAAYEPYLGPRVVVDTHLAKDPVPPVVNYLRP
ncbi:AAA family ATPase [Actinoplanes sp. RD1]|uniref:AAA family ATPase n=1 Tax=Actinoplanes sp. RD1 TaxID=3064538 RepID=UPI002741895B|nr:ATP-binding protein [Actinoplanes sp. RD1]